MSNRRGDFLAGVYSHARNKGNDAALVWYKDAKSAPLEISWGELLQRVAELQTNLAPLITPRTMVAIVGYSSPTLIAALLAVLRLDAVPALFPAASPRQDQAYFIKQQAALSALRPSTLISVDFALNPAEHVCPMYVEVRDEKIVRVVRDDNIIPVTFADDVLFVQHSSGTTGVKKGIPFTEKRLLEQLDRYARLFDFGGQEISRPTIGTWLPFYHDMGFVCNLLLPLYTGTKLVFTDPFVWTDNPPLLFKMIEEHRINYVWMPNFAFKHLIRFFPDKCGYDLSSVKNWINCSEPCKYDVMTKFCAHFEASSVSFGAMKCCYAMAETVFAVTQTRQNEDATVLRLASAALNIGSRPSIVRAGESSSAAAEVISNGPPLDGVEIATVNDGRFLPDGHIGEICIRAPFLFEGYLGRDNSDVFVDGFYRSGDVGFLYEGELYILGRTKDLIIINGRNFLAHEIEASANAVKGIRQGRVVALGIYSNRLGSEELVIVAEVGGDTAHDVQAAIRKVVYDDFGLTAREVRLVEERWIVKSSSGKISRAQNRDKYFATFLSEISP